MSAQPTPSPAPPEKKSLVDIIKQSEHSFGSVATRYLPPERLVKLAQVVISRTPGVGKCTPLSVVSALMTCARLGLEPNEPGGVWLVPYAIRQQVNGKWVTINTCTPIIDYRGLIDVARRSGEIAGVHASIRYANDQWEFGVDTSAPTMVRLRHVPSDGDRGPVVGVYFVARLKSGETHATYLTKAEVEAYRSRSKNASGDSSPWVKDWNAMAMKTACRRGVNLLPRTPEIQLLREEMAKEEAIEMDAIVHDDDPDVIPMPRRLSESTQPAEDDDTDDDLSEAMDGPYVLSSVKPVKKGQETVVYVVLEGFSRTYTATLEMLPVLEAALSEKRPIKLLLSETAIEEIVGG